MTRQHRILVVGTGSIGERHVRCYLATGRATVGICEPNADLRRSVAAACGVTQSFASLDEAIAVGWDAAVVATPASSHIRLSQQLAERRIHLLIEKPLATDLEGVSRLIETVEANALVAAVAYVYRVHPVLAAMKCQLASGRFGRPVQISVVTGQNFPFFRPAYRQTYYADPRQGGGAVQDALTHFINAGEWLVGPISRVVADADHKVLEGVDVEDTVHVLARHGDVMGCYCLNQHQAANETTITVNCTAGTVRFEMHHNRWQWVQRPGEDWHDEPGTRLERDDWFTLQCHAFLDALNGRREVPCNLREGLQTLMTSLAILASAGRSATIAAISDLCPGVELLPCPKPQ